MKRWIVAVLALVAISVCSAGIARADEQPSKAPATKDAPSPVTPVLSVRRAPEVVAGPVADRRLFAHLDDLLGRAPNDACLTVAVGGHVVYAHNEAQPLSPASVEKLTTADAILHTLDPASVLTTTVQAGAVAGGVVNGDLFLVGGGDPLLMTAPYVAHFKHQPVTHTDLEALADRVVSAGVRHVTGGIVGDGSRYDAMRYLPQWPVRFATEADIGPLSALMVNDGLTAFPPSPDLHVPKETPADDPTEAAADQFTQLLVARGVVVDGAPRSGTTPGGATQVASIDSRPIGEMVAEMLRESDNETAELLTKELAVHGGASGTTADGATAITNELQQLGLPLDGTSRIDASGLAVEDQATCNLIQAILDKEGPDSTLAAALPVAGQTGTLDVRFKGSNVEGRLRAKTGTLNQVTALAGYVQSTQGQQLSFAFVMNRPPPSKVTNADIALEDELGTILGAYPENPDLSKLGPK